MAHTSEEDHPANPVHPHQPHSFHYLDEPKEPVQILLQAIKSGARSAAIAYSARAVLTLLLRAARGRLNKNAVRDIVLDEEPMRFAKMFGSFTFIFKAINGLGAKMLLGRPTRRASLVEATPSSLQLGPDGKMHLSLRSPPFLLASFAGFVAGLFALRFEHPEERLGWAQQFFVRGLQAFVVFLAKERNIYVPHGDSLVFIFSCAQIMFAYIARPTTIPPAYYNWMVRTARVPDDVLEINRRNIRALDTLDRIKFQLPPESATALVRHRAMESGVPDPILSADHMVSLAAKLGASAERVDRLKNLIAQRGLPLPIVPCELLHACGNNGCIHYNCWLFGQVFKEIFRVYGVLNLVPVLVFGSRRLRKEPVAVAKRLLGSSIRSSTFLAVYVTTYMVLTCLMRNIHQAHLLTRDHKLLYYLFGIASGCSIFIERDGRRGELAAYVLPKAAESAWRVWADRGVLPRWIPAGDYAMFSVGLGLLMGFYQTSPSYISTLLYALMRRVIA